MSVITETWRTLKYMRTPENQPLLPEFPLILPEDIPAASAVVHYGLPGNPVTERICVHKHGCPHHPAFHIALSRRDRMVHNVGKFRNEEEIEKYFRSERRVDIIIYKMLSEEDRTAIMRAAAADESKPRTGIQITDYGVRMFLHQGFSYIRYGKKTICSADFVRLMQFRWIRTSYEIPEETAPFEVVIFALRNPDLCEVRTVWVGDDFRRKAAGRVSIPV